MSKAFLSNEFPEFCKDLFLTNYIKTKESYGKKGLSIKYNNDIYGDEAGKEWMYVKKRDYYTLALAFIDGYCDNELTKYSHEDYMKLKTKTDVQNFMINDRELRRSFESAYAFLKKHWSCKALSNLHGRGIKVYRGYKWTKSEWIKLTGNSSKLTEKKLLDLIDNTTKKFNSFSTSIEVSKMIFAKPDNNKYVTLLISGKAEPSDIYYPFSMYLMGRHRNDSEQELNINGFKRLKDLTVVEYTNPFEN